MVCDNITLFLQLLAIKVMVSPVCYSLPLVKVLLLLWPHGCCSFATSSATQQDSHCRLHWLARTRSTLNALHLLKLRLVYPHAVYLSRPPLATCSRGSMACSPFVEQWERAISDICCESLVACVRQKQWILSKANLLHVCLIVDCTNIWFQCHRFSRKQTDGTDSP